MAARSQTTCYPTAGNTSAANTTPPLCTVCDSSSAFTVAGGSCADGNTYDGSNACDGCNSCNSTCNTAQAYCSISKQAISSHADVGSYTPAACEASNQTIYYSWTAAWWNALQDDLLTANGLGKTKTQGASLSLTPVVTEGIVTAALYNQLVDSYSKFSSSISSVAVGDVIWGARAAALNTGFAAAVFNSTVCDVCNAGKQSQANCTCNCTCTCSCSCTCGCSCSCSCECGCSCSCSCECGCSCSCSCDCGCSCSCSSG